MISKRFENTLQITDAGGSGLNLTVVSLSQIYDDRRELSCIIVVQTNGTAPGASKNLTFNFASVNEPGNGTAYTAAELSTASEIYQCALQNSANVRRVYVVPNFRSIAPKLNFWFGCDALDGGAALTVTTYIYSNPER